MAVPKRKASKARTRRREMINSKLVPTSITECSNCGNSVMTHRVCRRCGFYKGKQVIDLKDMS